MQSADLIADVKANIHEVAKVATQDWIGCHEFCFSLSANEIERFQPLDVRVPKRRSDMVRDNYQKV